MKFLHGGKNFMLLHRRLSNLVQTSHLKIREVPNTILPVFLFKDLSKFQDRPAISCGQEKRTLTYKELKQLTDKVHYALKKRVGLDKGEVVGLILPNNPEFPATVFGALQCGLKTTFINPIFTPEEITRQFVNAEVNCIIAMNDNKKEVEKVVPHLKGYKGTVYLDNNGNWFFNNKSLLDGITETLEIPNIDPHETAILPYSSGTTGVPKGVMLSHHNCVSNLVQMGDPNLISRVPPDGVLQERVLNVIPFYHIYGFNGIMNYSFDGGAHIMTIPKFTPKDYLDCLKSFKPTQLFLVPSLLLFLASHPDVTHEHLESVKKITTGAAPATKSLIEKFTNKVQRDDVIITQGYGMSESSPVVFLTPTGMPDNKTGSTGVLVPSTQARIICLETGKDLPVNQSGELWIKGPQVMKGYLKNKEATEQTLDSDGWLHTGDVAYYDEDGYYYIVDRCKELIKCKGNQVSPTELEGMIMELDEVADVAVIGVPDERCGEIPRAFIVLKADRKLNEDKVNDFINPRIAPYKRLVGGIKFIDLIPRNHAGKVMRQQLRSIQI